MRALEELRTTPDEFIALREDVVPPVRREFVWQSDFDENGVLFYLGTDGGLDSILEYLQQEVSCRRLHLTHCLHVCRVYA